ncbi:MAG: hypothetical protein ACE5NP_04695 [Anaerolineae bacterium]
MLGKKARILVLALVCTLLVVGVTSAAPLAQETTYTVQKDDNLWMIAEKYYGNGAAYRAIVGATNKKSVEDPSFPYITDFWLIKPGWKLVIPSAEVAKEYLATYVRPVAEKELPTEITMVDTNSGSNFQKYWQTTVIPQIESDLGVKVNYVVSKSGETIERMKAWEAGKGDFHLLFVKPGHIADMVEQDIPLETMFPDRLDVIPNLAKCPRGYLQTALGINIGGKGALYWRSQYALIYNSEYITDPPTSWKEFYERRDEWRGHIGLMRPNSKSGSGRRQPYSFLSAFVDLDKPWDELKETDEFKDGWAKLTEFYAAAQQPLAPEPSPNLFERFNAGETWISFYAMDFALWSRAQGTMPPTIKAGFLSEGMTAGSDGYLAVPAGIPEEYKPVVFRLINYLLSDEQQVQLITTMWQYTGTDIWDKIPAEVWDVIPRWEDVEPTRIRLTNKGLTDYIKEEGPALLGGG